jgi:hypothetical protein
MSSWMRVAIPKALAAILLAALALVLLLLAAVGVTALVWHVRAPNRTEYVAKNNETLRTMPRPAGAREIARQVSPKEDSWGEQLSHTVGYWTDVSYVVSQRSSAEDVVSLFKERLAGWHQRSWTVDGTLIACFDRNGATVALDTTGMELLAGSTQKTYALTIDHNGGNCD